MPEQIDKSPDSEPAVENVPVFPEDQPRSQWADEWMIRQDTIYLNHGSFGPPPKRVRYGRRKWIDELDKQPMNFYVRELEQHLLRARTRLAGFVGAGVEELVFVDNATYGMNVVAGSFPLNSGDEVLINDHEYGAVHRIWDRVCKQSGASKVTVNLPDRFVDEDEVVAALIAGVTDKTRLLVMSHITSATALIMPAKKICSAFAERGIPVCLDGPHAPAQIKLNVRDLGCAFYTASCHKWLCAPLGSGFLYVAPKWQAHVQPVVKSWGRLLPAIPERWDEEFTWPGTRDASVFIAIEDAIDFMEEVGLDEFRKESQALAEYAETELVKLFNTTPLGDRSKGWYGTMAHVPLPPESEKYGDYSTLQQRLWEQFGIEIPVIHFAGRWFIRVSCHLYNNRIHIDTLISALRVLVMLASSDFDPDGQTPPLDPE